MRNMLHPSFGERHYRESPREIKRTKTSLPDFRFGWYLTGANSLGKDAFMPTPLERWVDETAQLTRPKNISWCDGSEAEYNRLVQEMLKAGTLLELNQKEYPGCYLHRSDPSDVARTEHLTFVCTSNKDD